MILQEPFAISKAAFNPLSISGCKFWVKANAIVGLNDGDPVATWSDQSGNANDATQSTAGFKPLYKTGIINSLPAVLFDGSDDFLHLASVPSGSSTSTAFVVTQPTLNTASQKTYASFYNTSNTNDRIFMVARLSTNFWGTFAGGDLSSTNALTSGTAYLLENTSATNSTFLYQRGVQVATSSNTETGTGTTGTLGKDETNANREYAGYIAEVIEYDSVLSSGNRVLVENYLIAKYAL